MPSLTSARRWAGALIAGALLAGPVEASLFVEIRSPSPTTPIFDEVEILAIVLSADPVERGEFFLDAHHVGTVTSPPYRLVVDVGPENVHREFRVVAHTVTGESASAQVETVPLQIDLVHDATLQQLYVTVEDRAGRRVLDLPREAFSVTDMGRRQEIVSFERGDVPLTAALLVDASLSMRGEPLRKALRGAGVFLERMKPLDEAMLLLFSDRIVRATPFHGDATVLTSHLQGVEAESGTALNDHIYLALNRLEEHQGRRVAILLTDGIDVESTLRTEELVFLARRSQAMLYWLQLDRELAPTRIRHSSAWRTEEEHRREYRDLERLVEASGGRILPIESLDGVGPALEEIMSELRAQYVLGYYPAVQEGRGTWHPVRVSVSGGGLFGGLRVRTTQGYLEF